MVYMNTGSILVYGGNIKDRLKKIDELVSQLDKNLLKEVHPDKINVSGVTKKKSIGISQIRALITFMSTKPYSSKYKVAIVNPADKMTPQAQNALLKILEEPPFYGVLILSSKSEQFLLPTLISRCRKIKPDTKEDAFFEGQGDIVTFKTILNYNVGEKLKLAEILAKKEEGLLVSMFEYWIREERYAMTQDHRYEKHKNVELLLSFLDDIENTNVNTRLALENLFLKI